MDNNLNIIIPKDFCVEEVADFRIKINNYIDEGIVVLLIVQDLELLFQYIKSVLRKMEA